LLRRAHRHLGQSAAGAVVCPCRQWSSGHRRLGTLVRHVMCAVACVGSGSTALAPATGSLCMGDAPAPRALVALRALAPRILTGLVPARPATVAVAAVAAAAQNDLDATSRAEEQAGGLVHAHPGTTEVLDGLVPARHTAVAPPSSARCRVRYGRQACRQERPLPCPPSSASPRCTAACTVRCTATRRDATPPRSQLCRPRQPGRPAGRPGWRALHLTQTLAAIAARPNQPSIKTATSPSNRSGS
jgi:hypothetical protein